jgi:tRNA G10  N-methylase Trm11
MGRIRSKGDLTVTILSAKTGINADLFPDILSLYAREGARILDMTFANGVFWKNIDITKYNLVTNDLFNPKAAIHEDFRHMSFPEKSFDMVVLDPPYMRTNNKAGVMANNYHNQTINLKTHDAIISLYRAGYEEAKRLLKDDGVLVVKCQDEIESGIPRWSHVELMVHEGFRTEDIFVLVRSGGVLVGRCQKRQQHARKNHSYFLILIKYTNGRRKSA